MIHVAKERDCWSNKLEFDTDYNDNLLLTSQEHHRNCLPVNAWLCLPHHAFIADGSKKTREEVHFCCKL